MRLLKMIHCQIIHSFNCIGWTSNESCQAIDDLRKQNLKKKKLILKENKLQMDKPDMAI